MTEAISFTPEFLSLARLMKSHLRNVADSSSIFSAASLAAVRGPEHDAAAMQANVRADIASRTVEVEAFCSCRRAG